MNRPHDGESPTLTLYVCAEGRELSRHVAVTGGEPSIRSATVVLRHSNGSVGFDRDPGRELLSALVGQGVFVAVANRPRWRKFETASATAMADLGRVVLACSMPTDDLMAELNAVTANEVNDRMNVVLARHGRLPAPHLPTRFDRWVDEDGRAAMAELQWMLGRCTRLSVWARSTWGSYGVFLGSTEDEALGPVVRLQDVLGLQVMRVEQEDLLPVW